MSVFCPQISQIFFDICFLSRSCGSESCHSSAADGQVFGFDKLKIVVLLDDHLRDFIAGPYAEFIISIGVMDNDLDFSSVAGIYHAGKHIDPVFVG